MLGGMGPEATLAFYQKLIANTPAGRDQDHLRVVIDSNAKIPDRTAAILGQGESPVPAMAASVAALAAAGADFVVIPCVSAHAFLGELRPLIRLPLISMLDVVADHLRQDHPQVRVAGLLATTGTVRSGSFQAALRGAGVQALVPDEDGQRRVMDAIYRIKASPAGRAAARRELADAARRLVAGGAQGVVLGCTEIPLVFEPEDVPGPSFDSVVLLARAAIVAAGRTPTVALSRP